jgi:ribonuclease HII
MTVADPSLRVEKALLRDGARFIIGCDEVGRGAIAGPIGVGVAMIDANPKRIPKGLRDSKMLSEARREELYPKAGRWAMFSAVGLSTNEEIDRLGLTVALGMAGARAIAGLIEQGAPVDEAIVILDGHWDWLNPALDRRMTVKTRIKADRDCASVAAASVLAKVHRDRMMIAAHDTTPVYNWASNKGYASSAHYAAIDQHGPSDLHRLTWLRTPSLLDDVWADEELEPVQ